MELRKRIILAIMVGCLSAAVCYFRLLHWQKLAGDFTFTWRAAQFLLSGINPYEEIRPEGEYPFQTFFYYPLTAALASMPFAWLPPYTAGAIFFGVSSALLAFALTANGWKQLPIFLSAPYIVAAATVQWSPVILAAALLPPLAWLLTCKPNLGAAAFLFKPTRLGLGSMALFLCVSLVFLPTWPLDWLRVTSAIAGHPPPAFVLPIGPLLLLGLLGWRKPVGRLFLGLSFFPQLLFFYDQLPLWLIPTSFTSGLLFSGLSWLAYFAWRIQSVNPLTGEIINQPTQYIMALVYLPALVMLLWQEKDQLMAWKQKMISRFSRAA